jgi:putative hydrolase of HD superfamily
LQFIIELEKLKTVKRHNSTLDSGRPENSAEHSWHIAVMAMFLIEHIDQTDIDLLKVIKMLLIHDLGEIGAGDTHIFDEKAKLNSSIREKEAMLSLTSMLPSDQRDEVLSLWEEFEARETLEATYAASIDAMQPVINHLVTAPEGFNPNNLTSQKVIEKKMHIRELSPELWALTLEIIEKSRQKGLYT